MNIEEIFYETPLTKTIFQKAVINKIPVSGTFELTPMCNFDCKMCYIRQSVDDIKNSNKRLRSLEEWKKIADEAVDRGMLYLLLTGGEPLSWPHFWELYEYLGKKGLIISINTNGSLINEGVIERFKKQPPARINITLYGASDETYERICRRKHVYHNVISAIEQLQEANILVKLNCSLTPDNVCDLDKMIEYANMRKLILQVNTYMFPPVRKSGKDKANSRFDPKEAAYWHLEKYRLQHTEKQYVEFLKKIQNDISIPVSILDECCEQNIGKMQCRAGKASFWATWDGAMLPCGMMSYPRIEMCGKSFNESWEKLIVRTEEICLSGKCEQCQGKKICHSCAAMAYAENDRFEKVPMYLCRMVNEMKKIAMEQLKIMA